MTTSLLKEVGDRAVERERIWYCGTSGGELPADIEANVRQGIVAVVADVLDVLSSDGRIVTRLPEDDARARVRAATLAQAEEGQAIV